MTTVRPPTSTEDDSGDSEVDLVALVVEQQARTAPERSLWWKVGFPAALVLLALAIPLLVWAGLRVILDSTDGQLVKRVTDPAAPGYEAVLEPTPTDLVVTVDRAGNLESVTVLALTSDAAGGVMTIPPGTRVPMVGTQFSLASIYSTLGVDALRSSVGQLLNLTFTDAQVIASGDWPGLVGPVAPVTVSSPDSVPDANGATLFPKGAVDLTGAQVSSYLAGRSADESDLNRMLRQQAFWRAWLAEVGAVGASGLSVPTDSGIGLFVAGLSGAQPVFLTLPVTPDAPDAKGNQQFLPVTDEIPGAVATIVPFPEGAPGMRPRLRVLDGTGQLGNGVSAALVLAAAGGQIDVVGNARSFGATTTQFVYYEPSYEGAARIMRDALGVGEVVRSDQTNSATDLTVVLGEDYLAMAGVDPSVPAEPSTRSEGG